MGLCALRLAISEPHGSRLRLPLWTSGEAAPVWPPLAAVNRGGSACAVVACSARIRAGARLGLVAIRRARHEHIEPRVCRVRQFAALGDDATAQLGAELACLGGVGRIHAGGFVAAEGEPVAVDGRHCYLPLSC
jgi:hypothetical protein